MLYMSRASGIKITIQCIDYKYAVAAKKQQ